MPEIKAKLTTPEINATTHIKLSNAIIVDKTDTAANTTNIAINIYIAVTSIVKEKGAEAPV